MSNERIIMISDKMIWLNWQQMHRNTEIIFWYFILILHKTDNINYPEPQNDFLRSKKKKNIFRVFPLRPKFITNDNRQCKNKNV